MTAIRSQTPSSSGGSRDHQDRLRRGLAGHQRIDELVICAFAETSIPRVGSSSKRTSTPWCRRRAMAIFCWLPPESSPIGWSGPWQRTSSRLIQRSVSGRRSRGRTIAGQLRERQVVGDAEAERQSFALAVLAHQRHPLRPARIGRGGAGDRDVPSFTRPETIGVEAGQRAQQLRGPRRPARRSPAPRRGGA